MPTATETAAEEVVEKCLPLLAEPAQSLSSRKASHKAFLRFMLGLSGKLPSGFLMLDASHPWMIFWPVNALALLKEPLSAEEYQRVGESVISCQHANGGFGGGPGQPGHLAATYAAVMALSHTGPEFWSQIDVPKLVAWIMRLKRPDGSISVCEYGEADPRSTYCALASLTLLGVDTRLVSDGVGPYIASCQTYEGGIANQPLGEAHGGYAFCGIATLLLLDPQNPRAGLKRYCDLRKLRRWLVARQDQRVPGFSGRTNKLVDGCYSHWVGGCWPLVDQVAEDPRFRSMFSRKGLHDYTLKCCQDPRGGLRDKPEMRSDAYHTNYNLCGLAAAHYHYEMAGDSVLDWTASLDPQFLSDADNYVEPINPVLGVPIPLAQSMRNWMDKNAVKPDYPTELEPTEEPMPSSKEYQGFAIYLGVSVALVAYLTWALLPAHVLHALQIDYIPSRWWAVALPAFFLMTWLYAFVAVPSYNTEKLTFPPQAPQTICDRDTLVQDTPLVEVNNALYRKQKKRH